jgi:type II secretory ATPase GspE/PulE/Tfp pilus assembly ATPase PilB-like protein
VIAAVAVLAVALVATLAFAVQRAVAVSAARARATELDERVATLESDLSVAANRADIADAKATKATAEAAAATKQAETSARDAKEATARADAEHERADTMTTRAEAAEAASRAFPADGVWALETRRIGRVWRDRVSVVLDGVSPVDRATDPAEAATRVLADASREEAGVVIDVSWKFDPPPAGAERVMVVRLAEELIAAAWSTDGADLDVTATDDTVELRLRTEPAMPAPADLADAAHACGADVVNDDGAVVVRLPRTVPRDPTSGSPEA